MESSLLSSIVQSYPPIRRQILSRKLLVFAGFVVGVAGVIALMVMLSTTRTTPQQPLSPVGQNKDVQMDQENGNFDARDTSPTTSSPIQDSTSGMFENNTSMIPKQAFDPYPYP